MKTTFTLSIILILGILTRILPHIPNFTPTMALAFYLGRRYPLYAAMTFTLLMTFIADTGIAWLTHQSSILGEWSLFTYSGILMITLTGFQFKKSPFLVATLCSALGFWVWTNLGSWLLSPQLYPDTFFGLISCYTMAIPFLNNALLSTLIAAILIQLLERTSLLHPNPISNSSATC